MSEERENAGAPIEESEATTTEVQAAVHRAGVLPGDGASATAAPAAAGTGDEAASAPAAAEPTLEQTASARDAYGDTQQFAPAAESPAAPRPVIAKPEVMPSAGPSAGPTAVTGAVPTADSGVAPGAAAASAPAVGGPAAAGNIVIGPDHPMAALYMQTPMPPDMRGNRGAGVLISIVATIVFAIVFAVAIALWKAPHFPPSTFISEGVLPWIMSWGFAGACAAFLLGMIILVLIFGRAGWWAYIFGGLLVGVVVWGVSVLGFAFAAHQAGESITLTPLGLIADFGLFFPVIAAAIIGREVTVWFGAWIGKRGRKITRLNSEALAEYETSLAEAQAKQP